MKSCFLFLLLFFSVATAQTFTKITTGPIVNTVSDSRSVNWVDYDNDGLLDLYISNGHSSGDNNMLYHNEGNGTFTEITNDPIVSDNQPTVGATWADMDNDGDLDCYAVNWYNQKNLFYENNGDGTFTLLDAGAISNDLGYSETATWGDYDNNGLVDLFVTNSAGDKKNVLYHNDGNAVFTRILSGELVTDAYASRGANWTDYDLDGDADLFVCNELNQFENCYRNDENGIFVSIPQDELGVSAGNTMSSNFIDYDNDGDLDYFLANYQGFNHLFRNNNDGSYSVMTNDPICTTPASSFGSNWGDIDNDGDLDLYVTNAFVGGQQLHNFCYFNNGDGTFSRDSTSVLVSDLGWSYGCAFGDYDTDGFLDLAVANCYTGGQTNSLFHNNGNANNWIEIQCVGSVSNYAAIGAKVKVRAVINGIETLQLREISAQSGYCGQNMFTAHFGLGDATQCLEVIIEWPSGIIDSYTAIDVNQLTFAHEGQLLNLSSLNDSEPTTHLTSFPNPFPEITTIEYTSKTTEIVTVSIQSLDGKHMRKLFNGKMEAGTHTFKWDAKNDEHQSVKQGIYVCIVQAGKTVTTRKIMYVSGN